MFSGNWRRNSGPSPRRDRRSTGIGREGYHCEPLEPRQLLATDLGTLGPGRLYLANQIAKGTFTSMGLTQYTLTIPDCTIDIYMSFDDTESLRPHLWMTLEGVDSTVDERSLDEPQLIHANVAAGTYTLDIANPDGLDRTKTIVINVDLAPGEFPPDAPQNIFAGRGRDLGTLPASNTTTVSDFVGDFDGANLGADLVDTYLFDIPVSGTVRATLDQLAQDPAGNPVSQSVTLFRDLNRDGFFDQSTEVLASRTGVTPGAIGTTSASLSAGHYAAVVRPEVTNSIFQEVNSGSNYRLRLSFIPPDGGGDSLANATNIGTVGGTTVTRTDYLSAVDTTDTFKFNTLTGGPFVFDATVGGLFPGSDNIVQLINDANGDGSVDAGEILDSAETFNGSGVHVSASLNTGTYFVRLIRAGGEGSYTLSMVSRNTDQGGPASFPTNVNFSNAALGQKEIVDTVSATDVEDVFRFSLERNAALSAVFPATAINTNANMQLFRDSNNDNMLNAGDALVASSLNTGNAAESIQVPGLSPAQYFVRILRVAGTPQYDLKLNVDYAGSNTLTARQMALSGDDASTIEFVGPGDTLDLYRIDVNSPTQLNIFLSFISDFAILFVGPDSNHNLAIDSSERLLSTLIPLGTGARETVNLPSAGSYDIGVGFVGSVGMNYGIVLATAPPENAGNTESSARFIGHLGGTQSFTDFVGDGSIPATSDPDDFYEFFLGTNGPFVFIGEVPFVSPGASIEMDLIRRPSFFRGPNVPSEVIATTSAPANLPVPPIVAVLTDPADYFVHVFRLSGNATYTALFTAVSTDTAGNSEVATARFLGQLGAGTNTVSSGTEFVGRIDRDDVYMVNVATSGELSASLTGASPIAFVDIVPIPPPVISSPPAPTDFIDIFNNAPAIQKASTRSTQGNDIIQGLVAAAGNYLIRVHSEGDTNYNLSVSFTPEAPFGSAGPVIVSSGLPTSGVTLEAENFDEGGEGVAYHDTTAGNQGNADRTTDVDLFPNLDGGFHIERADAGEFENYTIFAQDNGQFDIDVRCGSATSGGTFHLEVDGVPVGTPQSLSVPLTGFNSLFATVTASNIFLSQGPHLLRLVMDSRAANQISAGGFDSLTIRRSQSSIGTFVLTPQHATVLPGVPVPLAVQWTVPGPSWHELKTIDVRLRAKSSIGAWLRFEEASNTVRLYNVRAHRFGPSRRIGSRGVLSSGQVAIRLNAIKVIATGPNSPVVTLQFTPRFLSAHARHYLIDVAASNDAGFIGDFVPAGTLDVHRRL